MFEDEVSARPRVSSSSLVYLFSNPLLVSQLVFKPQTSASKPFTVAIIGGGIFSVVLTIALRRRNVNVQLYERNFSLSEISASLGVNSSAAEALKACAPEAYEAFLTVRTPPADPNIGQVFTDGFNVPPRPGWTVPWDGASGGVHRGKFLEALVKHLPEGSVQFGGLVEEIEEAEGQQSKIIFKDGTTATADAIIGADGMGSHVHRYMLGRDHPSARALYAHQYCYRAVLDTTDAVTVVDAELTQHTTHWMGQNGHVITVPISRGTQLGLIAFVNDSAPWASEHKTVLPATKDEVVAQFSAWSPAIRALIDSIHADNIDRWAMFDFAENPVPTFSRGTIALAGDSAHATCPHLGSGAMTGIEDAAVLAELLGHEKMEGTSEQVSKAFEIYNRVRIERGHWVPRESRRVGEIVDSYGGNGGLSVEEAKVEIMERLRERWTKPVWDLIRVAREELEKAL